MHKSLFRIDKMDCPSEEQMIRMKLESSAQIHSLDFDIPSRQLTVYHSGSTAPIHRLLNTLDLGTSLVSESGNIEAQAPPAHKSDRSLLWIVLLINFFFFILELITGLVANSMGLLADGLDMLADSFVYGLALVAAGGSLLLKKRIAAISGYLQLALALAGIAEVIRRFIFPEPLPAFKVMIIVSALALAGNVTSLYLLQRSKNREAHMQASMIFTSNDIIANLGVIAAAFLVLLTGSKFPDLIVGSLVFILVVRGALRILKLAH